MCRHVSPGSRQQSTWRRLPGPHVIPYMQQLGQTPQAVEAAPTHHTAAGVHSRALLSCCATAAAAAAAAATAAAAAAATTAVAPAACCACPWCRCCHGCRRYSCCACCALPLLPLLPLPWSHTSPTAEACVRKTADDITLPHDFSPAPAGLDWAGAEAPTWPPPLRLPPGRSQGGDPEGGRRGGQGGYQGALGGTH